MLQHLPRDLRLAVGRFLAPSPADAELCCSTNLLSRNASSNEDSDELPEDTTRVLYRVLDALDTFHELLNTCRWANVFFPKVVAAAEFSPMLARCGCPRLLAAAPPPAPVLRFPCKRWPSMIRGVGTELHLAVISRNVRAVRVAAGRCCFDLDQPDSLGETALFKACMDRFAAGARVLLELRADPDAASGDVAGWDGCRFRSLDDYNPRTPLLVACAWRDAGTVDLLLARRANPNGGCSALLEATTPLAALSMRPRVLSVARRMDSHLYSQFEMEGVPLDMARALLAARADPEGPSRCFQGRSPVWLAARDRKTAVLDLLLRRGAFPNATDCYGDSALHMAYLTGHLEGVLLLLDARADPNAVDVNGATPEQVQGRMVFQR